MPEPAPRDGGPKSRKKCRKGWKYDGPGLHLGALWGFVGAAGEALDDMGTVGRHKCSTIFHVSVSRGAKAHILGETESEWYGINPIWTAQARVDRICTVFRRSRSWEPKRHA